MLRALSNWLYGTSANSSVASNPSTTANASAVNSSGQSTSSSTENTTTGSSSTNQQPQVISISPAFEPDPEVLRKLRETDFDAYNSQVAADLQANSNLTNNNVLEAFKNQHATISILPANKVLNANDSSTGLANTVSNSSHSQLAAAMKKKDEDSKKQNTNNNDGGINPDSDSDKPADPTPDSADLMSTLQTEIQTLIDQLQKEQTTWESKADKLQTMGSFPSQTTLPVKGPKPTQSWLVRIEEALEKERHSVWESAKELLMPHVELEEMLKRVHDHILKKLNEREKALDELQKPNLVTDDQKKLLTDMCLRNCEMLAALIILLNQEKQLIDSCLKFDIRRDKALKAIENYVIKLLGVAILHVDISTFINDCISDTDNDNLKLYRNTLANKLQVPMERVRFEISDVQGEVSRFQTWLDAYMSKLSAAPSVQTQFSSMNLENSDKSNVVEYYSALKNGSNNK